MPFLGHGNRRTGIDDAMCVTNLLAIDAVALADRVAGAVRKQGWLRFVSARLLPIKVICIRRKFVESKAATEAEIIEFRISHWEVKRSERSRIKRIGPKIRMNVGITIRTNLIGLPCIL